MSMFLGSSAEFVAKVGGKRVDVDVFGRDRNTVMRILSGASGGGAQADPVRGFVTGPPEPAAIYEALGQVDRVAISLLPIVAEHSQCLGKDMACQAF